MRISRLLSLVVLVGCSTDAAVDDPPPAAGDDITPAQRASLLFERAEATKLSLGSQAGVSLQDYAAECDAAVGLHVPAFDCDVGIEVPNQGTVPAGGSCAAPNVLNQQCDPGSKFQILAQNSDAAVVAHCRKVGLPVAGSTYNDIAVIQYNKTNGAVCFYQALTNLNGANVRAPSEGSGAWPWFEPWRTHNIGCTACHDSGGFIRSPYIRQVGIPSTAQGFDNLSSPLRYVGGDYANDRSWSLTAAPAACPPGQACTPCNACHRLAVNNVGFGSGTASDFALRATAATQTSKLPHGPGSPIWMRPGQVYYSAEAEQSAQSYAACATGFLTGHPPAGCSATQLGTPFQPAINWGARGDDIALFGSGQNGAQLVVAFSNDNGTFGVTNTTGGDFASWARAPGVQRVTGDFNKDGRMDIALVGGPGWNTIPVAFSQGNGTFVVTNLSAGPYFNSWSNGSKALVGDFNKDGYADIALVGGAGWNTIPVAFAAGGGSWQITNSYVGSYGSWATTSGVKPLVGDFNKDGYSDIALVGPNWSTIPVAFAAGGGSWQVTTYAAPNFGGWASTPNVTPLVGDFNKDGYSDIALTGGVSWGSIPIAFAAGGGSWQVTNYSAPGFAFWAGQSGVRPTIGDFNKDGYSDIALTGGASWGSIPIAFAAGGGSWQITTGAAPSFGPWASTPGARTLAGDFNGDGYTDIALIGGNGWGSIPVAFSTGGGNFAVTNQAVDYVPGIASDPAASIAVGRAN